MEFWYIFGSFQRGSITVGTLTQNENFTLYSKVYILMISKVSGLIFSVIKSSMPYQCS